MFYYGGFSGLSGPWEYNNPNNTIVLRLIIHLLQRESTDELLLDYLKVLSNDKRAEYLFHDILTDDRNHYDALKKSYVQIARQVPKITPGEIEIPNNLDEGLFYIMSRKKGTIKLYSQLKNQINPMYINEIDSFIVDELTHMHFINYLLNRESIS
ncbi:hypothetical protein LGQ02_04545 [Bacillus shivajii]|uniref:hypothetical protein n=1 Tax=Bacillus shivajii TaxID=1983719 RepID=UPI001CFA7A15|nr:hypothetical protein [Bacillus shivajii]UCZ54057.1 hypothetical protein LGQ02_04545 [Bacillus shivajii]